MGKNYIHLERRKMKEEVKTVKLVREEDELIGVMLTCEFEVIWHKRDFETEEEAQEFMGNSGEIVEHAKWEFYDSRVKDLEITSETILEFVDVKIYVCHKCGRARRVEPRGIVKWPECGCIGQTEFDYETVPRTIEEAKEILEKRYEEYAELYRGQSREVVEFQALMKEYCIGEDGKLDMKRVMKK